jgi:hypothetical protein
VLATLVAAALSVSASAAEAATPKISTGSYVTERVLA